MANPIDKLLDDLSNEYSGGRKADPLQQMLTDLWAESERPAAPPAPSAAPRKPPAAAPPLPVVEQRQAGAGATDRALDEVRQAFQAEQAAEARRAREQEAAAARAAADAERQRRKRAEAWLRQLDPYSTEGMWFHELAQRYATPLEAAMEYLDSVKGQGPRLPR